MQIQGTLKRSFVGWNSGYLLMMLVFGVWGAYDYWVKIPNQEIAAIEYVALAEELRLLQESEVKPLPEAQANRYEEVKSILKDRFDNTPPRISCFLRSPPQLVGLFCWLRSPGSSLVCMETHPSTSYERNSE